MIESISGNIVDVLHAEVFTGTIKIHEGKISQIIREDTEYEQYLMPGFVDSHIHIESTLLPPSEFGRIACTHGTVAAVCDPHEIANVMGLEGIYYMLENAISSPLKCYFGAPSCVPATPFETNGAKIGLTEIKRLLKRKDVKFLAEAMDYPGVINSRDPITSKIQFAKKLGKPIDGHAPGLRGPDLHKYFNAGIRTDHEATDIEEALEKLELGMSVQIREGSAAKSFDELSELIDTHYKRCMLCSDDKHPDELIKGHINSLVKRGLDQGIDLIKMLWAASVNPVAYYGLDVGLLYPGDAADFIVVDNLEDFNILRTYVNGEQVSKKSKPVAKRKVPRLVNNFSIERIEAAEFALPHYGGKIRVIEAEDKKILTGSSIEKPHLIDNCASSDTKRDILKIAVVNRYSYTSPAVGFVRGFGLKKGAIASSIAHDSHNIVAVGTSDLEIRDAVNIIIENQGGLSAAYSGKGYILPLPIAGLMSDKGYATVAKKYAEINKVAQLFGSKLTSPYMTLSFMALPVIPSLKMTDYGLFDVERFGHTRLFVD